MGVTLAVHIVYGSGVGTAAAGAVAGGRVEVLVLVVLALYPGAGCVWWISKSQSSLDMIEVPRAV